MSEVLDYEIQVIELYMSRLKEELYKALSLDDVNQVCVEVRSHLEDRVNDLMKEGLNRMDAELQATFEFGESELIARDLIKDYPLPKPDPSTKRYALYSLLAVTASYWATTLLSPHLWIHHGLHQLGLNLIFVGYVMCLGSSFRVSSILRVRVRQFRSERSEILFVTGFACVTCAGIIFIARDPGQFPDNNWYPRTKGLTGLLGYALTLIQIVYRVPLAKAGERVSQLRPWNRGARN